MRLRLIAFATLVASIAHAQSFDQAQWKDLRYRQVGPSRGGRVTAVAGVIQQPYTFYFGSTGGGVWKTDDAGINWRNVTDGFIDVGSIGAIDVADSDPNIVYVGTGSDGIRSNVSTGKGAWKSTDAGRTWTFIGLRNVGQIGAVVIHPTDPNTVWIAAIGHAFGPNPDRGVYKTTDGGRTWKRTLFISDSTGAVDIELKPGDPTTVYASAWHGERKPWTIISGNREGGIYKSTDGGETWRKLGNGLPNDIFGKSDLAVSAADPTRVYALIEAKPGSGLYRSDDSGENWRLVSDFAPMLTRPFYYTNAHADPTNADVIYTMSEGFFRSTDGGRTWRSLNTPHGDNHDLWINPTNNKLWIQSNDGGANVTLDGGRTWSTQLNQPTAELYMVNVDNRWPYRLYGAQQDVGRNLTVPSLPVTSWAPPEWLMQWEPANGCETGPVMPHPTNPDTVYGACKGQFGRFSQKTGQEKQYWTGAQSLYGNDPKNLIHRFQRVSPMQVSPNDPRVVYYGSQYVNRTRDEGVTWERISPDLTAFDPKYQVISGTPVTIDVTGEEFYSTLYSIAESAIEPGVIWTGSNDGPIHVTRDNGKTWTNVTPAGLPPGGRVQTVEPSPHRKGSAYAAVLRYMFEDWKPYVYATRDYGKTWRLLTTGDNGVPNDWPTRVVREDPDRQGLLYLGTEFGMFVSFDDGATWSPFQLNLPRTPVTDIKVHRKDLVLSTQGRSFWILDNLTPLHQMAAVRANSAATLLTPREAIRWRYRLGGFGGEDDGGPAASPANPQYPPPGAMIDYIVGNREGGIGNLTLEIFAPNGALVRRFSSDTTVASSRVAPNWAESDGLMRPSLEAAGAGRLPTQPGLNRFIWDLTWPGPWDANAQRNGRGGPMVAPGTYKLRFTSNGVVQEKPLVVRADPRVTKDGVTQMDLVEQERHNLAARDLVTEAKMLVAKVGATRRRLANATGAAADTLSRYTTAEGQLVPNPIRYSEPRLLTHITYLYSMTTQADQKIGRDAVTRMATLRRDLDAIERSLGVTRMRAADVPVRK